MWFMRLVLFISLVGVLESYAGPKNFGQVVRHSVQITEVTHDEDDEGESMIARSLIVPGLALETNKAL